MVVAGFARSLAEIKLLSGGFGGQSTAVKFGTAGALATVKFRRIPAAEFGPPKPTSA